jgi:hypothetical protein
MLFTPRGLAQATGEAVARYKAARIKNPPCVDLCCGIGGDLIALAACGSTIGVDRDDVAAFCAKFNCESLGRSNGQVVREDVRSFTFDPRSIVHLDPDRRPGGSRTVDLNYFEPNLEDLESLIDRCRAVSLKLAPATRLPDSWYARHEIEWIGHRGECKQQVVWTSPLAQQVGRRVATVLSGDGSTNDQIVQSFTDRQSPQVNDVSAYLYEPHSAVLAAGLSQELADQIGARRISNQAAYLTADRPSQTLLASCFRVIDVLHWAAPMWKSKRADCPISTSARLLVGHPTAGQSSHWC